MASLVNGWPLAGFNFVAKNNAIARAAKYGLNL